MIRSSNATSGCSCATRRADLQEQAVAELHDVRLVAGRDAGAAARRRAYSNANRTIRSLPALEIALIEIPRPRGSAAPVVRSMNPISSLVAAVAHLELDARVHALGVLADDDEVDALVDARARPRYRRHGRTFAYRSSVARSARFALRNAAADRRLDRSLQRDPVDRIDVERALPAAASRSRAKASPPISWSVPLERDAGGVDRPASGLDHLGPDAVARDEGDAMARQSRPSSSEVARVRRSRCREPAEARSSRTPGPARVPGRFQEEHRDREGAARDRRRARRRSPTSTAPAAASGTRATRSRTSPSTATFEEVVYLLHDLGLPTRPSSTSSGDFMVGSASPRGS